MSSKGSGFRGTRNKDNPAALVVCSYLGWPITGGVAAAIHQLIYYLHAIGLAIYCTAFKVNNEDQNEFRESGTNLVYPNPPSLYRRDKVEVSWLHNHKTYFPDISELESVKMVFSFSMVTSIPASVIRENVFPDASFYVVNPYKLDTPLSILGYDEYRYQIWKEFVIDRSKDAKAVFSMGSEIYHHFDDYYQRADGVIHHFPLKFTLDDYLFDIKRSTNIPDSGNFRILMFVDKVDIAELSSKSLLAQAMNHVTESFHRVQQEPPKWVIVSIPKGSEDDLRNKLNPESHPYLDITYKSFEVSEAIHLLQESHLLVVPPSSTNFVKLSLTAIAIGIPLLVPQYSSSQKAVDEYLRGSDVYESAVDMKSDHTELSSKINRAITNYTRYTEKASALRSLLKVKSKEVSDEVKEMLVNIIMRNEDFKLASQGEETPKRQGQIHSGGHSREPRVLLTSGLSNGEPNNKRRKRKSGHMSLRLCATGGVPENDKPMADIENDLLNHASTMTNAQTFMKKVAAINSELSGEGVEKGSLKFIIRCGSSDATDALWKAYSSGQLDSMADETFLSIPILDDIGARMLSLEIFLDYQEYVQCKEELRDTTSHVTPVHHTQRKDSAGIIESLSTNMAVEKQKLAVEQSILSQRQNSCHKSFLREGGTKLKQQKNMPDDMKHMENIRKGQVEELDEMKSSHYRMEEFQVSVSEVGRENRIPIKCGSNETVHSLTRRIKQEFEIADDNDVTLYPRVESLGNKSRPLKYDKEIRSCSKNDFVYYVQGRKLNLGELEQSCLKQNIAIVGSESHGKSSTINTISKSLGQPSHIAQTYPPGAAGTSSFMKHELWVNQSSFVLFDVPGEALEREELRGLHLNKIFKNIFQGKVKPYKEIGKSTRRISRRHRQIHAVVVVQKGTADIKKIPSVALSCARSSGREIPVFVIITHIDLMAETELMSMKTKLSDDEGIDQRFIFAIDNDSQDSQAPADPQKEEYVRSILNIILADAKKHKESLGKRTHCVLQ